MEFRNLQSTKYGEDVTLVQVRCWVMIPKVCNVGNIYIYILLFWTVWIGMHVKSRFPMGGSLSFPILTMPKKRIHYSLPTPFSFSLYIYVYVYIHIRTTKAKHKIENLNSYVCNNNIVQPTHGAWMKIHDLFDLIRGFGFEFWPGNETILKLIRGSWKSTLLYLCGSVDWLRNMLCALPWWTHKRAFCHLWGCSCVVPNQLVKETCS